MLHNDIILKVENISKKFCSNLKRSMLYGTFDVFRSIFGISYNKNKLRKNEFWALKEINFELKKGETLGIIGANGAGKSTLLRLITGIFPPDKGKITFNGNIGALIAVGAGFHPHMTGRENIYLNGTILGMKRKEIDEKINDIIDFSEIGDFLDAPISTYSSGMRVRLGFSIAVHCEPDILLIDEVLSVGDLSFRNKSLRKMSEFKKKAKGLIYISHNLEQIKVLCDRVIVLNYGEICFYGKTDEGLILYENLSKINRVDSINKNLTKNNVVKVRKTDNDKIVFNKIGILTSKGNEINKIDIYDPLILFFDFSVNESFSNPYFLFSIVDEQRNTRCIWLKSNDYNKFLIKDINVGKYRIKATINKHNLGAGVYFVNCSLKNSETEEKYEQIISNFSFSVTSKNHFERGVVNVDEDWQLESIE